MPPPLKRPRVGVASAPGSALGPTATADAARPAIDRIVFTGDFLRPSAWQLRPTQHHNIRWLYDLLSHQISMATGLPCSTVLWRADDMKDGVFDNAAIIAIYKALGEPGVTIAGWARLHHSDITGDAAMMALMRHLFGGSLVVGFELPPVLIQALKALAVPYIDTGVHPVRFMDDLPLAFLASSPAVQSRLRPYGFQDSLVRHYAGITAAAARRGMVGPSGERVTVFVAQTDHDKSSIQKGRFVQVIDFQDQLIADWENYDRVLVKAHPLEPHSLAVKTVLSMTRKAELVDTNIYALLGSEAVQSIATISSSVGIEARYFGKGALHLYQPSMDLGPQGYVGVLHDFLQADFWRDVLTPLTRTTEPDHVRLPVRSNRLRLSLKSAWGFQD